MGVGSLLTRQRTDVACGKVLQRGGGSTRSLCGESRKARGSMAGDGAGKVCVAGAGWREDGELQSSAGTR